MERAQWPEKRSIFLIVRFSSYLERKKTSIQTQLSGTKNMQYVSDKRPLENIAVNHLQSDRERKKVHYYTTPLPSHFLT